MEYRSLKQAGLLGAGASDTGSPYLSNEDTKIGAKQD